MEKDLQTRKSIEEISEYYKLEIQEVLSRLDSLENLRAQLATFISTANLTGLGFAFSTQKAGILILASLTVIFLIAVDMRNRRHLAVYYYRGLQLQRRFAPDDEEVFLNILPGRLRSHIRKIHDVPNIIQRHRALNKIHVSPLSTLGFWMPFAIMLIEMSLGVILWQVFNWSLF